VIRTASSSVPLIPVVLLALLAGPVAAARGAEADGNGSAPVREAGHSTLVASPLPPMPRDIRGAFCGVVNGAIIVAGGAEDVRPGGEPASWRCVDTVYILPPPSKTPPPDTRSHAAKVWDWAKPLLGVSLARKAGDIESFGEWRVSGAKLPFPVAFGAAAVHDNALVCIGGWTSTGTTRRVFRIRYDGNDAIVEEPSAAIPALPRSLAFLSARALDNALYVAGGISSEDNLRPLASVYRLEFPQAFAKAGGPLGPLKDWAEKRKHPAGAPAGQPALEWKAVPFRNPDGTEVSPVGEGLLTPLLDVRYNEGAYRNQLYIMGGLRPSEAAGKYLDSRACWRFVPGQENRAGWRRAGDLPQGVQVASSCPIGPSHLLVLGRKAPNREITLAELAAELGGGNLFLYHTYTDTWVDMTAEPLGSSGTVLPHGPAGGIWIGTAADSGGTPAPAARKVEVSYNEKPFGVLNALIVYLFFAALVAIGYMCRKKDATTEEYFLSGRKIPWWASGLSMWATGVSAISLMAIPSKTYATDWTYMWLGIFPPIMLSLSAIVFMPLFRRLSIMSMTEYFEMRFNVSIRLLSSFLGVVGHTGVRMSVTLLVPALALSAVTGWDVYFCVAVMGVVTILYTVVGGMDAVIWTDVAQSVIMFVAPILSIGYIIANLGGGMSDFLHTGVANAKFRLIDMSPDLTVATFWVFAIWSVTQLFAVMGQETMQRAWATDGVQAAKKSVYTLAAVSLPGTLLFYSIGTSLFVYYRQHPEQLNPTIKTDAIFPLYIVQNLPTGLAGLMIAAIFAAAISMAMNTSSTMITRDFFRFFRREAPDRARARFGWWCTLVTGVIATGIAVLLAGLDSKSLWDLFAKLMALAGGGFGGVIVLGLLTKRASTAGAWAGTLIGTAVLIYLEVFTQTSFFTYGTVALVISVASGYAVSLVFPDKPRNLEGLTVWTLKKDSAA
jgi:SSS family transporter